jgi:perosamine synthetase
LATVTDFIERIQQVSGAQAGGLHEPAFLGNEKKYLAECIDSGYVSSVGAFVGAFEDSLRDYVGAAHAIAAVNGTTALHLALVAVGVRPGDEVLVPAMSFVATANAVSHAGAIAHFVDVDASTWGIDPVALRHHLTEIGQVSGGQLTNKETGRPIIALVPMHALGHPADIKELLEVAQEFGVVVVEDAAESLGSFVGDQHTGLFGSVGVFSFNGNKTITTGGGGALVTNDEALAGRLRHLSTTARIPDRYEFDHDQVGYNYRMPNINAALGLAQMEQLPDFVARQRSLHASYQQAFGGGPFGEVHTEPAGATSNYWLHAITLPTSSGVDKNALIAGCIESGVGVRPLWKPLNSLAPYSSHPSASTPVTDDLYARVICLPSSASLAKEQA